ncbi:hypothetical protein M405DRAFT_231676 [Rhizopogon salebrosus TDB-379]|nr:hypothetical protein M405DRAFT_231676 [Rhizopogon salebrosus TDB-379]
MDKDPGNFSSIFRSLRINLSCRSSLLQFSISTGYKPLPPGMLVTMTYDSRFNSTQSLSSVYLQLFSVLCLSTFRSSTNFM